MSKDGEIELLFQAIDLKLIEGLGIDTATMDPLEIRKLNTHWWHRVNELFEDLKTKSRQKRVPTNDSLEDFG